MKELEQRYRAALRWFPRRWRTRHEEALLGILLDQADHEGRTHMSPADRRDLAGHGLRRRLAPVLLGALLVLGGLALFLLVRMVADGTGLDTEFFTMLPRPFPVPVGSGWTPPFEARFTSGALYLSCAAALACAAVGAVQILRRMRRA